MGVLNDYTNAAAVNAALNKGVEANKAVSELKEDLNELDKIANITNYAFDFGWEVGFLNNGVVNSASTGFHTINDFIPFTVGEPVTITIKNGSTATMFYSLFDENKNYVGSNARDIIGKLDWNNTNENIRYAKICFSNEMYPLVSVRHTNNRFDDIEKELEKEIEHSSVVKDETRNNSIVLNVVEYENIVGTVNGYLKYDTDGSVNTDATGFVTTNFIPVKIGDGFSFEVSGNNTVFYCTYDKNKNRIHGNALPVNKSGTFMIDNAQTYYIRFCASLSAGLHTRPIENSIKVINNSIKTNDYFYVKNKKIYVFNPYKYKKENVYKGQIHCHSNNSDGRTTPQEVIDSYANAGYDFITITDHNVITEQPSDMKGMVWLCNSEEDTYNVAGHQHANIYGVENVVNKVSMYEARNDMDSIERNYALSQSAIIQYNHPNDPIVHVSTEDLEHMPKCISLIEVWNTADYYFMGNVPTKSDLPIWPQKVKYNDVYYVEDEQKYYANDSETGTYWVAKDSVNNNPETLRRKDFGLMHLLDNGHKVFATATDDYHGIVTCHNYGWLNVFANKKEKSDIWKSILDGNFYASAGVTISNINVDGDGYYLEIDSDETDITTTFYGYNNAILGTVSGGNKAIYKFNGDEIYVRAEVKIGRFYAWTQPVWICKRERQFDW